MTEPRGAAGNGAVVRTWAARWLGLGRVPEVERQAFEREGLAALAEGLSATAWTRSYRAPGIRSSGRGTWFVGAVAVTTVRLAAYGFSRRLVSVRFDDPRCGALEIGVESGRLAIGFDAERFSDERSGRVELRFSTARARQLHAAVVAARGPCDAR